MKKVILLFISFLLLAITAQANGLTKSFIWETHSDPNVGTGIRIGTITSGTYEYSEDAGINSNTYALDGLVCEKEYFVTAFHYKTLEDGTIQTSDDCQEVSFVMADCPSLQWSPMPNIPDPDPITSPALLSIN